jgi:hypothetical protein
LKLILIKEIFLFFISFENFRKLKNLRNLNFLFLASIKNFSYGSVTSGDLIEHNIIEVVIYNIDPETCTALTGVTNVITYFAQISVVDAFGRHFTCTGGGDVSFTPGIKEQNVKVIKLN